MNALARQVRIPRLPDDLPDSRLIFTEIWSCFPTLSYSGSHDLNTQLVHAADGLVASYVILAAGLWKAMLE